MCYYRLFLIKQHFWTSFNSPAPYFTCALESSKFYSADTNGIAALVNSGQQNKQGNKVNDPKMAKVAVGSIGEPTMPGLWNQAIGRSTDDEDGLMRAFEMPNTLQRLSADRSKRSSSSSQAPPRKGAH